LTIERGTRKKQQQRFEATVLSSGNRNRGKKSQRQKRRGNLGLEGQERGFFVKSNPFGETGGTEKNEGPGTRVKGKAKRIFFKQRPISHTLVESSKDL